MLNVDDYAMLMNVISSLPSRSASRLPTSIGNSVKFNWQPVTVESLQFISTVIAEALTLYSGDVWASHTSPMEHVSPYTVQCETSHCALGQCETLQCAKGQCEEWLHLPVNLLICVVWATVENPWDRVKATVKNPKGSVKKTVPWGECWGCPHTAP